MTTPNGEDVLDALLYLGYAVDIDDEGRITATNGDETLKGRAESGAIEWADRSGVYRVRERAYIARLRGRVEAAHHAPKAGNGDVHAVFNGTKRRTTAHRQSPSGQ